MWGATSASRLLVAPGGISIHAPRVGRDAIGIQAARIEAISIHAPRVGRDVEGKCAQIRSARFQSTRPVWGATSLAANGMECLGISIHAPRVGRDLVTKGGRWPDGYFNPRAPCGARPMHTVIAPDTSNFNPRAPCGARLTAGLSTWCVAKFQSTRPVWGATTRFAVLEERMKVFQSTRPVWGATWRHSVWRNNQSFQSTRPVWGATIMNRGEFSYDVFQSTRPVWGATMPNTTGRSRSWHFNPRAPCGARPRRPPRSATAVDFNPRAPCGARPEATAPAHKDEQISIHAPRVGRDITTMVLLLTRKSFQSTRPVWGATSGRREEERCIKISIHAPRVGRDRFRLHADRF